MQIGLLLKKIPNNPERILYLIYVVKCNVNVLSIYLVNEDESTMYYTIVFAQVNNEYSHENEWKNLHLKKVHDIPM